ncbi:LGFP repeat-containing protein [Ferruginibacter yonginensis]|uniref:LGFP repeat-containing protein n=1 Tax=Ferruginibacter yonginensis TaxID=1310416 RepID=A0ABV8QR48_9BACT
MKALLVILLCSICNKQIVAQLNSTPANTTYDIAQMISVKAKQKNLGAIHTESNIMRPTAGKGGYFLRYEKGWVYYNPRLNQAFAIWGETMKKYQAANYEMGWLGFPTTDPKNTPNRTGTYQHFDGGSIYYSPTTGYHSIGGAFKDYWSKKGWENSAELGFPTTDEVEIFIDGYTRYQQFEKGTLFFAPNKPVLYSNNPNAVTPPKDNSNQFELTFTPMSISGKENGALEIVDYIDLYGWMDIRVYQGNGTEVIDADGKSFSLFNIDKSRYLNEETSSRGKLSFVENNNQYKRFYNLSQTQINDNAYIRITYWLNDHDETSADDYLKLQNNNGSWRYNNGNHPYKEIKLKEIIRNNNILNINDHLTDGSDYVNIKYKLQIKNL